MTIEEVVQGYDSVVEEKLTFAGVLKKGIDNIGRRWKAEGTKRNNMADYRRRILPMFADKPIEEYTLEYCEQVVEELSKNSRQKDYKQNTRKNYLRLIKRVFEEADSMGVCTNPFWGSKALQRNTYDLDEKIRIVAKKLVKFFTVEQEFKICNLLFKNPYQDACSMGLLLMFITGARNLEAAAICYEDIVFKGGGPCIVIINSIEGLSAKVKAGTKTKNGYRYYPISMLVYNFLMLRKAWLQEKAEKGEIQFKPGSEFQSVDNLPIACNCETWPKYCTPNDLTDAGRELFKKIGITSEQVQIIRENMKDDEKNPIFGNFKDPTAYSFRRSNASHMYDVHCTILQCRYLMGHAFNHESVERYHLVNDDQINMIRRKLANRPLVNEINYAGTFACFDHEDDELYLKNVHNATLSIKTKGHAGQTLIVRVVPREPHVSTIATLFLQNPSEKTGVRMSYRNCRHMEKEQPSDVVVPREIHSLYDYWKPYVEAYKAECVTIKALFADCNEKKVLSCVADIEDISYDHSTERYHPVLKNMTDIVPTEKTERCALAMLNPNGVSVMCFNAEDARTFLAANSKLDLMTERSLEQSVAMLDLEHNVRMLRSNSIRGRTREDVLSMRIPKDIINKIGAERIAAKILSEMTLTSTDADVTKLANSMLLSDEETLAKNRELALFISRVYCVLKEYSYLWRV